MRGWRLALAAAALAASAAADEPPVVEHQPVPCTVPEKPFTLCATITDDAVLARARVLFRPARARYFSAVDMAFGGLNYCGTLPPLREGKVEFLDYYLQAVDDHYQTAITSTYRISVQPEGACASPPVETDPARAGSIVVQATHQKQGRKLPDAFRGAGVSFVPVEKK